MILIERVANSFIHSGHFYSAPSSPLLLRGAPDYSMDTVPEFHAEAHRQLQVKDFPKVPMWRLERESNPRPSGWMSSSQPRRHHVPRGPQINPPFGQIKFSNIMQCNNTFTWYLVMSPVTCIHACMHRTRDVERVELCCHALNNSFIPDISLVPLQIH